jgi:hypothetical protein
VSGFPNDIKPDGVAIFTIQQHQKKLKKTKNENNKFLKLI